MIAVAHTEQVHTAGPTVAQCFVGDCVSQAIAWIPLNYTFSTLALQYHAYMPARLSLCNVEAVQLL